MPQESLFTERNMLLMGLSNDSTDTAVSHPADTLTKPSTTDSETATANHVVIPTSGQDTLFHFFGQNAHSETFDAIIFGWEQIFSTTESQQQWTATFLLRVDCVTGEGTGIANGVLPVADYWVDTITLDTANIGTADYEIQSPVDDGKATLIVRHKGFILLDVWFDMDAGGNNAAGCNLVWRNL
jgi:hypothetical protein